MIKIGEKDIGKRENAGLKLDKKTMISITLALAVVLIFAGVMTQILPTGEFERSENGQIISGTYRENTDYRIPIWKVALSPILCFGSEQAMTGAAIILFIVLVGGAFLILDKCGIMKYIMASLVKGFEKRKYLLLSMMVLVLMGMSSITGILEESITLVPLAVAVSLALGWDSLVGLGISLISVAWGFTAATFNPYNIMTVQKLIGLKIFSGLWLRLIIFAGVYLLLVLFLILYAKKIEKNPEKSLVYESDKLIREKFSVGETQEVLSNGAIKKATRAFIICMALDIVFVAADFIFEMNGAISLPAMAILFTVGGLLSGHLAGLRGRKLFKSFMVGVKTIAPAIPLIILVIAVAYILDKGMIIDTILNSVYGIIDGASPYQAIFIIFAFVIILEFFLGSSTAKAFLIMPILAPLSDMINVTRQSLVTSFCLADGFTNLLFPTSGVMIIAIGLVGVSYGKWLRWSWKLFLINAIFSSAILLLCIAVGYGANDMI